MSIEAITGALGSSASGLTSALTGAAGTSAATAATSALPLTGSSDAGGAFGSLLTGAIDQVQAAQGTAKDLAVQAVTGELSDVHDYTIAASEANLAIELTAAIRNKAVDAFNEIMRMQA